MTNIYPLHWGKINVSDSKTFPIFGVKVLIFDDNGFKNAGVFFENKCNTGEAMRLWLFQDGSSKDVLNGDIWCEIPRIPQKLL